MSFFRLDRLALSEAQRLPSLLSRADLTINELPSGVPVQPSDLIAIYRDETRQVPVSALTQGATIPRMVAARLTDATYTPTVPGLDVSTVWVAPPNAFLNGPAVWQIVRIYLRCEVAGTGPTQLSIARYTGAGAFTTTNIVNSTACVIASGFYEGVLEVISAPTLNSGDKLACNFNGVASGISGVSTYVYAIATF